MDAPRKISITEVSRARDHLVAMEPSLRCILHPSRQCPMFLPSDVRRGDVCVTFARDVSTDEDEDAQALVDAAIGEFAASLVLTEGPLSAIILLRGPATTRLVFVFHHFVADYFSITRYVTRFLAALERPDALQGHPSPYLDFVYQRGVGQGELAEPRDITVEPLLPCLGDDSAGSELCTSVFWALAMGPVSPARLVVALDLALKERFGMGRTRIDVSEMGRRDSVARRAGGWLAHAVPLVSESGEHTDNSLSSAIQAWPSQFLRSRLELGLGSPANFRAHAFLNFLGNADLARRGSMGYRLSTVQARRTALQRRSETPFHFEVSIVSGRVRVNVKSAKDQSVAVHLEPLVDAFLTHALLARI